MSAHGFADPPDRRPKKQLAPRHRPGWLLAELLSGYVCLVHLGIHFSRSCNIGLQMIWRCVYCHVHVTVPGGLAVGSKVDASSPEPGQPA